MKPVLRKILRAVADYDPEYYDMYADPNEALFGRLYVERITQHADAAGIRPSATEPGVPRDTRGGDGSAGVGGRPRPTLLEAGCQAGRLVVPFAKLGFQVTGIDASDFALRRAQEHAREAGVDATFIRGDLIELLRERAGGPYDLVICAEVLYQLREYRELLQLLAGAVRPGGLLCVSHRPKWYYLIEALRQDDLSTAAEVQRRSEGPFRDSAYFNWQAEGELQALYRSLGLRWLAMYPIDRLAWLSGLNPSQLTGPEREEWLRLELEWPPDTGTCARYVLVVAERPSDGAAG